MRPKNFVNAISQKPMKVIHLILVTDVFGFIDALIRFWVQKVKGQGHGIGGHVTIDDSPSRSI